ncbi:MAG: inorganic phosphate transporter [Bacteroidales bacterium]|nr:inorganic phosphate transporter [Bacteroidales bacterium]
MDSIYLIFVIILFVLAISDLIVGVTNDAVNFLNSAVGARATSFKMVMLVASIGVLVGATFSSGLMEIARKGLFFPAQFSYAEVLIIFMAVMVTDVILLDLFNTFGLPTSTTVSIVFELLGASVAIAIIKITGSDQTMQDLGQYINAGKALAIITAILVSVALAFSFGAIIQYITRIIFTFNLRHNLKYYAAIWGGLAITGIIYFIVIKGAKGASFMTETAVNYIESNTGIILLSTFIGLTILLQLLMFLFKLNVLKLIVLLANDVKTETWMLLIAGFVMSFTLWTSKKARTVIETSVDLSRQGEGNERFNSSILSRNIVRGTRNMASVISGFIPDKMSEWLEKRFEAPDEETTRQMPEGAAFDMLRASVNLVVASVLIAFGTSLKLPLSTTYVTFMVAMGSSLSDRAWGRESAVYRITGVLSVIGGWFFTALAAFTVSLLAAIILFYGGLIATILLMVLVGLIIYRTHIIHLRRAIAKKVNDEMDLFPSELTTENIITKCSLAIQQVVEQSLGIFNKTIMGLVDEDRKLLHSAKSDSDALNVHTKRLKTHINATLINLKEDSVESGHFYVQAVDYLREVNHCIAYIVNPAFDHVENNHRPLIPVQVEEISRLNAEISLLFGKTLEILRKKNFEDIEYIFERQRNILRIVEETRKKQIRRIKNNETGTRNSILFLNTLAEIKNLTLFINNILKASRDFEATGGPHAGTIE